MITLLNSNTSKKINGNNNELLVGWLVGHRLYLFTLNFVICKFHSLTFLNSGQILVFHLVYRFDLYPVDGQIYKHINKLTYRSI